MTIETFENEVQPVLKNIEGISSVTLDDYNSEELVLFMEIEKNANLKKLTPTIKRALKEKGFAETLIADWTSPSAKDQWGNRNSYYYEMDLVYAYADIPKIEAKEDAKEVMVFAKDYEGFSQDSDTLKDLFTTSFDNQSFSDMDEHIAYIDNKLEGYTVNPLFVYRHSGEHFEASKSCRWDSSFIGAVAILDKSDETVGTVIDSLNDWLNGPEIMPSSDMDESDEVSPASPSI